ncbi:LOW QUALITY PROTEIN: hypothetical protein RJ640_024888 [Escallonia rubra]|uniref:ADP-ribosyl cyclase/cyclic ADP-ribose hydrolase n=1 Tax=Escallonia rubra TaxID=112253 RepID=A0AA88RQA7_9ASTE|nr:LOW QUALITY PROTEIN: hypothetical protein RJ640_024888 [Escallonia rubra]
MAAQLVYDVFLKAMIHALRTFTEYLFQDLEEVGIRTFKDTKTTTGESISTELVKAMKGSRVSVIVFSRNYIWCLEELEEILEKKKNRGHPVVPVFYRVDPCDRNSSRNASQSTAHFSSRVLAKIETNRTICSAEAARRWKLKSGVRVLENKAKNRRGDEEEERRAAMSLSFRGSERSFIKAIVKETKIKVIAHKKEEGNTAMPPSLTAIQPQQQSPEEPTHDVFLHFGGKKVHRFVDSLSKALVDAGIRTFLGGSDIRREENSNLHLENAMRRSRSTILQEKRIRGHVVLPVFYRVTPFEARMQKGHFDYDFETYSRWFEEEKVEAWRAALREVAAISGLHSQNVAEYW